jgi:hypothetical protein
MKENRVLGGILATVSGLMGLIGHTIIFLQWYVRGMGAEAAEPGCEILLKYIHPALSDLGMLAGVIFLVSAYGAFLLSVIAIVLALQGAWFINVPFMAASLPPVYFILFWPYLVLYFLIMVLVGKRTWGKTLLGLLLGMAWVFCLMNGIASLSRIITIGMPFFVFVQRLHWVAMIGWGITAVGVIMQPKEWMRVLGIGAGVLEIVVGYPLAVITGQELGRFSLFSLAPIACTILVILLVMPSMWSKIKGDTS